MSQNFKIFVIAALIFLLSFSLGMLFYKDDLPFMDGEKLEVSPQMIENNLVMPMEHMDYFGGP